MSAESIKQRVADATPNPKGLWIYGHVPQLSTEDADLLCHAPADLALLLAVAEAAEGLNNIWEVSGYGPLREALDALEAAP